MGCLLSDIAASLSADVQGDIAGIEISDVASIEDAGPSHLTYLEQDKNLRRLSECSAAAVLVAPGHVEKARARYEGCLLAVDDPQGAFIQVMLQFRPPRQRPSFGISPQAIVAGTAVIGEGTNIHPRAVIGEGVRIGKNCDIHPGAVIGAGCVIGNDCQIYPNAVLYPDVIVGDRVLIHSTAVLGADGFGYRFLNGEFVKIPHTGTVVLEDDVEIGAGTTIDRAMLGATRIRRGTKLDNQVMIGHNCDIGEHNAFASQVGLAGSVRTGRYVRCAGQAGIADHLYLGEGCTVGPKSGLHSDVPAGQTCQGIPALPIREQFRVMLTAQKLPAMAKDLTALKAQVEQLTRLLESDGSASPGAGEACTADAAAA